MRYHEISSNTPLVEAFNTSGSIAWDTQSDTLWSGTFQAAGQRFLIEFSGGMRENGLWSVIFYDPDSANYWANSGLQGTGAIKVMSIVFNAMISFLAQTQVAGLLFTGDAANGHAKVYSMIANRLSPEFKKIGYKVRSSFDRSEDNEVFQITRVRSKRVVPYRGLSKPALRSHIKAKAGVRQIAAESRSQNDVDDERAKPVVPKELWPVVQFETDSDAGETYAYIDDSRFDDHTLGLIQWHWDGGDVAIDNIETYYRLPKLGLRLLDHLAKSTRANIDPGMMNAAGRRLWDHYRRSSL